MKSILAIVVLLTFSNPYFSQTDSLKIQPLDSLKTENTKTDSIQIEKESAWTFAASLGLNLSFTKHSNQTSTTTGGGFSTANAIDLTFNYAKKSIQSSNEIHWQFAFQKTDLDDTPLRKTLDDFNSLHDFSIGFSENNRWNVNLISKVNTVLLTSYEDGNMKDLTNSGAVQKFLNSYEVVLSPGIKYQPSKYLKISLSPYTYRFFGVTDPNIARTGLYIQEQDEQGNYKSSTNGKTGAEINIWYDRKIKKWLLIQYRLDIKSNDYKSIFEEGMMNGIFITKFKIIGNLYLTHRGVLRANLAQNPFKPPFTQTVMLTYSIQI
jgi:hypothetical protein